MTIKLRDRLNARIDNAMLEYNKFQERFAADPAYAMAWADNLFAAAATIDVYKSIVKLVDEHWHLNEIIDDVDSAISRSVRGVTSFSTSQTSNLFDAHKLRILSDAREYLVDWREIESRAEK